MKTLYTPTLVNFNTELSTDEIMQEIRDAVSDDECFSVCDVLNPDFVDCGIGSKDLTFDHDCDECSYYHGNIGYRDAKTEKTCMSEDLEDEIREQLKPFCIDGKMELLGLW